MKKSLAVILGTALVLAAGANLAQETKVPAPKAARPAAGVTQMDEQIKRMQTLHDKMTAAKTPEERQKLMEEQRRAMREGMGTMNQMMGGGGMMGGPGGGMMGGPSGGMMGGPSGGMMGGAKGAPADPNAQMQMMQRRMDMMQMMMQMMMDQQTMTGGGMAPGAAPKK